MGAAEVARLDAFLGSVDLLTRVLLEANPQRCEEFLHIVPCDARWHRSRLLYEAMPGGGASLLLEAFAGWLATVGVPSIRVDGRRAGGTVAGLLEALDRARGPDPQVVLVDDLDRLERQTPWDQLLKPLQDSLAQQYAPHVVATVHRHRYRLRQNESAELAKILNDHHRLRMLGERQVEKLFAGRPDAERDADHAFQWLRGHPALTMVAARFDSAAFDELDALVTRLTDDPEACELLEAIYHFCEDTRSVTDGQAWLETVQFVERAERYPVAYQLAFERLGQVAARRSLFAPDRVERRRVCRFDTDGAHDPPRDAAELRALQDALRRHRDGRCEDEHCADDLNSVEVGPWVDRLLDAGWDAQKRVEIAVWCARIKGWLRGLRADRTPFWLFRDIFEGRALDESGAIAPARSATARDEDDERSVHAPLRLLVALIDALRNPSDGAQYARQRVLVERSESCAHVQIRDGPCEPLPTHAGGQATTRLDQLRTWLRERQRRPPGSADQDQPIVECADRRTLTFTFRLEN